MVRLNRSLARYSRLLVCSLLLLALDAALRPAQSRAQAESDLRHIYTFGQTATFYLRLPAGIDSATARLYLRYLSAGEETTTVLDNFSLADTTLRYERDLRDEPFPPFARITYWWEYTHDQGRQQTPQAVLYYEDNRFPWQTLQEAPLTLHWVTGDATSMVSAMDVAREALQALSEAFQIPITEPLDLYIYPSVSDLQSALRLGGREWVGGDAQPELGVALLAIPPSSGAYTQMQRDIPHELAHLILYRYTGSYGYTALPGWLLEGLPSNFEQRPDPSYAVTLAQARQEGRLIPLNSLCGSFPLDRDQALLAYAESASVTWYLRQTYGWSGIRELLDAYADGRGCAEGLQAIGSDLPTLERDWRVWLEQGGETGDENQQFWVAVGILARDIAPWLLLVGVLLLPGLLAYLGTRGRA